jgi:hypothetical protein
MGKSMRTMLLLAKAQTAIDVDATPTAAANAILCKGLMPSPITGDFVSRDLILPYKGSFGSLAARTHRKFEFEVELAGAGAAGTAPKYGPLLKACGFSETTNAGVSVVYAPVSSGEPWVTLDGYLDGVRFKMINAKGTVSFGMNARNIPTMKFTFLGDYQAMADLAFPTGIDFTGFIQPKIVGKANTSTFTFMAQSLVVDSFGVDVANALSYRELIGFAGAISPNRTPNGTMLCELPAVATLNFGDVAKLGTTGAVQVIHGTTAGNIAQVDMPKVQVNGEPSLQNQDDIAMLSVPFSVQPSASTGNDEITLTIK